MLVKQKGKLKTKIQEHLKDTNKRNGYLSVSISDHNLAKKHEFE